MTTTPERELLDEQPIADPPFRVGMEFAVYRDGTSVNYTVTEIVERDGRRYTYGEPSAGRS